MTKETQSYDLQPKANTAGIISAYIIHNQCTLCSYVTEYNI